jgi:hypothetical protein
MEIKIGYWGDDFIRNTITAVLQIEVLNTESDSFVRKGVWLSFRKERIESDPNIGDRLYRALSYMAKRRGLGHFFSHTVKN